MTGLWDGQYLQAGQAADEADWSELALYGLIIHSGQYTLEHPAGIEKR